MQAARASLLAADAELAVAAGRGMAAGVLPALADDALYLEPGQPLLRGRDSVAAFFARSPASGAAAFRWSAARADLSADGTLGYTFGYGTAAGIASADAPGAGDARHVRYAAAWRRAGGSWRVAAFLRIDAPSPPPAVVPSGAEALSPPGARDVPGAGAAAARDAIMRADAEFSDYSGAHGLAEGFATYAAPDAAMLAGAFGREAIRASFAASPPDMTARWRPVAGEAAASGDFGYTVGTAEFRFTAGGRPRVTHSKYLTVWRKQPTGQWRWVFDGGNTSPSPAAEVRVVHEAARDLTGDGRPDRVRVVATGTRYDSLEVRLELRTADDSLRHLARWDTRSYFKYEPLAGKPDSAVERIVRAHLAALVADSAFMPRTGGDPAGRPFPLDVEVVRYDVAEHAWRARRSIADTTALTPEAQGSIVTNGVPAGRVAALVAELRGRPQYTYYAGAEETYTLAWSDRERRFVRVFACC